jgi:GH24 family phage-related lysozyme (muramidase)
MGKCLSQGACGLCAALMLLASPAIADQQKQQTTPAQTSTVRTTRPLPENYIERIKQLEGFRACERGGLSGYNTRALVQGECIPKQVASDRLYDELLENAALVDGINGDLPVGMRAALVSLTHNVGPMWTGSYLGTYVRDGHWTPARELFVAYTGNGTRNEQEMNLRRRRQELSWWPGIPGPGAPRPQVVVPPKPKGMPVPQQPWRNYADPPNRD